MGRWRFDSVSFGDHLAMHKRLLLLLLLYEEFFITLEKEDGEDDMHEVHVDDVKYKIQTEGKRGEKVGGKESSLNVEEQKHSSGHKVVSSNASYVIEPGADYSSTDAGIHSNGNDYLTFQGLPDYLAHLKDGVSGITGVVNQVGKSDKSTQKVS